MANERKKRGREVDIQNISRTKGTFLLNKNHFNNISSAFFWWKKNKEHDP